MESPPFEILKYCPRQAALDGCLNSGVDKMTSASVFQLQPFCDSGKRQITFNFKDCLSSLHSFTQKTKGND